MVVVNIVVVVVNRIIMEVVVDIVDLGLV